jgi:hypothetical protein
MSLDRLSANARALMLCEYNGYTFSPAAETTELRVTPMPDAAQRTVVYSIYSISIKDYLAAPYSAELETAPSALASTAASLGSQAVARLQKWAAPFRYEGRGVGDLSINTGGRQKDVVWGPRVKGMTFKPHGAYTTEFTWSVEVAVPTCSDAKFAFALMEFNFKLAFEKDRQGYTTRIYSGHLRIPQTRAAVGSLTLSDSADAYLERIAPPLLKDFRRIPGSWELSEDKCTGRFSITDEQLPGHAPPPGVIEARLDHTYSSTSLGIWTSTLSGDYTLAKGVPAAVAVEAYLRMVLDRSKFIRTMRAGAGLPASTTPAPPPGALDWPTPATASVSETDVFGHTQVRITSSYMFGGVGFSEVLLKGGLWSPPAGGAGGDWTLWAQSAGIAAALGARGHAKLTFNPREDAIIDLCGPAATPAPPTVPTAPTSVLPLVASAGAGAIEGALKAAFPKPPASSSWLYYCCSAVVHTLGGTGGIPITTLPPSPLADPRTLQRAAFDVFGAGVEGGAKGPIPGLGSMTSLNTQQGGETTVQQRVRPQLAVTITGQALRVGYAIPCPEIVTINGKKPVLIGEPMFAQRVVHPGISAPIVKADWSATYLFVDDLLGGGAPAEVKVPETYLL